MTPVNSKCIEVNIDEIILQCNGVYCDNMNTLQHLTGVIKSNSAKLINAKLERTSTKISYRFGKCYISDKGYDINTYKIPNYNYSVISITVKDKQIINNDDATYYTAIFYKDTEELYNYFYEKVYKLTPIPMLRNWARYVYERLPSNKSEEMRGAVVIDQDSNEHNTYYTGINLTFKLSELMNIISTGLKNGDININGTNTISETSAQINGLDRYLDLYGDVLTDRIKNSFTPSFIPDEDTYSKECNNYDDYCAYNNFYLLPAQKALIEASARQLNKTDSVIIIGETGAGKTVISIGSIYAHSKVKTGLSVVIMCPSHLCYNWTNELTREAPNNKVVVIEDLYQLKELEPEIKNKKKNYNLFVIMSYEKAKNSYEERPVPIWSESKHGFVCPDCGKVLQKRIKRDGESTYYYGNYDYVPLTKDDFIKKKNYNMECHHWEFDSVYRVWEDEGCGCKLWGPLNRFDSDFNGKHDIDKWIKLGKSGWLYKTFIDEKFNDLDYRAKNDPNSLTDDDKDMIDKILDLKDKFNETGELKSSTKGVRKYSIAKYIKKKLNGQFDYFIADEIHMLEAQESEQGKALGLLCRAAKKSIGLTGTLLNGYADSLFYIIYRFMPSVMKKFGYGYGDSSKFQRDYGVIDTVQKYRVSARGRESKIGSLRTIRQPGISPLIFTDFLLENGAFISLSDMADGLPGYSETVIGVDMDNDLANGYDSLLRDLRSLISFQGAGKKGWSSYLQNLKTYPDMPYNNFPVLNPITKAVACTPIDLGEGLRNKENRLIELVQNIVLERGEKVMVYYEYTNRTDVGKKLAKALNQIEGVKAFNLTSSNSKSSTREITINKHLDEGYNVMLCNNKLVETGLNLLDFTSIIFYQISYSITSVRQSSRRSWRLSQHNDVHVYYLYYRNTIQENAMKLMSKKMKAACVLEGKGTQEGLSAMTNDADFTAAVATSIINGINDNENIDKETIIAKKDVSNDGLSRANRSDHIRRPIEELLVYNNYKLPAMAYNNESSNVLDAIYSNNLIFNVK